MENNIRRTRAIRKELNFLLKTIELSNNQLAVNKWLNNLEVYVNTIKEPMILDLFWNENYINSENHYVISFDDEQNDF